MIVCTACQAENSADSKFCKICGRSLEPDVSSRPAVKPEEIDSLLEQGFVLVHERRLAEALCVAEAILQADPENSSALALKAMCHEERGEIEAAVDAYEQVVQLNPDSPIDRLMLAQLQRKLPARPAPEDIEASQRNWVAILSGAGAALVVIALGVILALSSGRTPQPLASDGLVATQPTRAKAFDLPPAAPPQQPPAALPSAAQATPAQPTPRSLAPTVRNPFGPVPPMSIGGGNLLLRPDTSQNTLPLPDPSASAQSRPTTPSAQPEFGGPSAARSPARRDDENILQPARDRKPGFIRIVPHQGSGDAGANDPAVSDNTYRVAQQKMAAGDYRGAARDFQASLTGSRKPALTHQLIARCYKHLGDAAGARRHFQIALGLFEDQAKAGVGGAQAGAEACRRELADL